MCISAIALGAVFVVVIIIYHSVPGVYIHLLYVILDLVGIIISLPTLVSCSVGDY